MSIIKEIVERHDGKIEVTSTVGKGSHFKIIIPQPEKIHLQPHEEEKEAAETKTEEILKKIKGTNILLAEDNPVNQKIATIILTKSGCHVDKALDGAKAVEKLTQSPKKYHVIFMDMFMPEMDGLEATKVIRKKGFKDIPIIAMTARTKEKDKEKCLDAGMDDFITKPIYQEAILNVLDKWI
jgi:CheY-like chemotaxis protein